MTILSLIILGWGFVFWVFIDEVFLEKLFGILRIA